MMLTPGPGEKLRAEVYDCNQCAGQPGFVPGQNGRLYKFPPVIGRQENAEILFIGINPRKDDGNANLHEWAISMPEAFTKLAQNRDQNDQTYIAIGAQEKHYHCHMIVLEGVYAPGIRFEDKAAVTEVYHCANARGVALLNDGCSPCAQNYLARVLDIVQPKVVVAVGSRVRDQLKEFFSDIIKVRVVKMTHPRQLAQKSVGIKKAVLRPAIAEIKGILKLQD